jgi:hypothetical protein
MRRTKAMTDREKLIALLVQGCREERGEDDIPCCEESFCKDNHTSCYGETADYLLANGVVVREKGEWEIHGQVDTMFYCSKCKLNVSGFEKRWLNFCPICGADMRKGEHG